MIKIKLGWYDFRLGSFTFRYDVLADSGEGRGFELDLQVVVFQGGELSDVDMDVIDCERVYDLAIAAYKNLK